jgi:hypothetical protein
MTGIVARFLAEIALCSPNRSGVMVNAHMGCRKLAEGKYPMSNDQFSMPNVGNRCKISNLIIGH